MKKSTRLFISILVMISGFFAYCSFVSAELHTDRISEMSINGKKITGYDYFYVNGDAVSYDYFGKKSYFIGVKGENYTLFIKNTPIVTVKGRIKTFGVSDGNKKFYIVYDKNGKDTLNINGKDVISVKGEINKYSISLSQDFSKYKFLEEYKRTYFMNGKKVTKKRYDSAKYPFYYNTEDRYEPKIKPSFLLHGSYSEHEYIPRSEGYIEKKGDKLYVYIKGKQVGVYDFTFNNILWVSKDFKNYAYYVGNIVNVNGKIIDTNYEDSSLRIWDKDFNSYSFKLSEDKEILFYKGVKYEGVHYYHSHCSENNQLICFTYKKNGKTYYNVEGKDIAFTETDGNTDTLYSQGRVIGKIKSLNFYPHIDKKNQSIIGLSFSDWNFMGGSGVRVFNITTDSKTGFTTKNNTELEKLQKRKKSLDVERKKFDLMEQMKTNVKVTDTLSKLEFTKIEELNFLIEKINKNKLTEKQKYIINLIETEHVNRMLRKLLQGKDV